MVGCVRPPTHIVRCTAPPILYVDACVPKSTFKALISKSHEMVAETKWVLHFLHPPPSLRLFEMDITRSRLASSRHNITAINFGFSIIIDALNNPSARTATDRSVLGLFFMDNVPDGWSNPAPSPFPSALFPFLMRHHVQSRSERNNGEYMHVEGCLLTPRGKPIPSAVIEMWE